MASSYGRTIVATKPLRKPVNPASPTTPVIDEVDNGDGTVTVRLALSSYVHVTETSLALNVLAGWRAGEAAASAAVTSASTFAAALPIFRWADVPYQRSGGTLTLELTVFSHHPVALQPVAGVKFTVTDGTTVKTAWATALSTSTRYGDSVRVYAVTIDGTAATALTAGLLRCDAEVYPWLGAMRSTDTAGTRSMTGLTTTGYGDNAASPFVVGYDPAGTRYGARVIYVDPAGTATANAAMVKPDLATAKALAVASRPRDITTAVQALYLANASLAAANGQGGQTRSADAARIVLAVGTHSDVGSTTITTGLTTAELPVRVEGDPDDANPRGNCILQTAAAGRRIRGTKAALSNLTVEVNTSALFRLADALLRARQYRGARQGGQRSRSRRHQRRHRTRRPVERLRHPRQMVEERQPHERCSAALRPDPGVRGEPAGRGPVRARPPLHQRRRGRRGQFSDRRGECHQRLERSNHGRGGGGRDHRRRRLPLRQRPGVDPGPPRRRDRGHAEPELPAAGVRQQPLREDRQCRRRAVLEHGRG